MLKWQPPSRRSVCCKLCSFCSKALVPLHRAIYKRSYYTPTYTGACSAAVSPQKDRPKMEDTTAASKHCSRRQQARQPSLAALLSTRPRRKASGGGVGPAIERHPGREWWVDRESSFPIVRTTGPLGLPRFLSNRKPPASACPFFARNFRAGPQTDANVLYGATASRCLYWGSRCCSTPISGGRAAVMGCGCRDRHVRAPETRRALAVEIRL